MKSGPIILIEDDHDDEDIFEDVLKQLEISNKLIWFTRADEAFHFFKNGLGSSIYHFLRCEPPGT